MFLIIYCVINDSVDSVLSTSLRMNHGGYFEKNLNIFDCNTLILYLYVFRHNLPKRRESYKVLKTQNPFVKKKRFFFLRLRQAGNNYSIEQWYFD